MKKLLLAVAFISVLFLGSCNKDEVPEKIDTTQKKYAVNFTADDFEVDTKGFSAQASDSISYFVDQLDYVLYNQNGRLVKRKSQTAISHGKSFGNFQDSLPKGIYTACFVGSRLDIYEINGIDSLNTASLSFPYSAASSAVDLFLRNVTFTVDTSVTQNVNMQRSVGKLVVKITDLVPTNVEFITIVLSNEANTVLLKNLSKSTFSSKSITARDSQYDANTWHMNVLNTGTPFNVIIKGYTVDNKLVAEKTVPNVQFANNKVTTLTGKLFDKIATSANPGFSVIINGNWSTGSTINF